MNHDDASDDGDFYGNFGHRALGCGDLQASGGVIRPLEEPVPKGQPEGSSENSHDEGPAIVALPNGSFLFP